MTDETLLSLEELEETERKSKEDAFLEEPYDIRIVERELILICSLILVAPDIVDPPHLQAEDRNDFFRRYWSWLYIHSRRYNRSYRNRLPPPYYGEEQLPDVCGRCFRSVGFCAGGRIRFSCRECHSAPPEDYPRRLAPFQRYTYPARICYTCHDEPIFAQLIYKYHSPNGDRSWKMKSLMS